MAAPVFYGRRVQRAPESGVRAVCADKLAEFSMAEPQCVFYKKIRPGSDFEQKNTVSKPDQGDFRSGIRLRSDSI